MSRYEIENHAKRLTEYIFANLPPGRNLTLEQIYQVMTEWKQSCAERGENIHGKLRMQDSIKHLNDFRGSILFYEVSEKSDATVWEVRIKDVRVMGRHDFGAHIFTMDVEIPKIRYPLTMDIVANKLKNHATMARMNFVAADVP